jgi:hypothetical protein
MNLPYEILIRLKYEEGISTVDLVKMFPQAVERVSSIALLDIPENTLREVVREERELSRLLKLKKRFHAFFEE